RDSKMSAPIKSLALLGCMKTRLYLCRNIGSRSLFTTPKVLYPAHDAEFAAAKDRLGTLKDDPGNQTKLQMYALFKQASVGKCNTKKPGMMDFVGKAKWDAWNGLGEMSQDDAQLEYINIVEDLVKNDSSNQDAGATEGGESGGTAEEGKFTTLLTTKEDGLFTITLNRPEKKNAISFAMYEEIGNALEEAAKDPSVVVAAVTGAGDYYCSGNDLTNFMNVDPSNMAKMAEDGGDILKKFVGAFIDFPKPLVGVINGPSVGVSCTVLGLFDLVYAADNATFNTPFSALGQSPEGCSSYTFPKIMGTTKANEMLLFNRKLTAQEACERGLVTEVFPESSFQNEAWDRVRGFAKLPKDVLLMCGSTTG
ncbi:unnamed protein product, partial [Owenia fusiformis]